MADEGGVWRTIAGRKVFIKDGQSVGDAMKKSGKFKKNTYKKVDSKGTMSPDDLNKKESRRDELWDKEDHKKITPEEKKELEKLEKDISDHYDKKKSGNTAKKKDGKSTSMHVVETARELKKSGNAYTDDQKVAKMYAKNANPNFTYTVKKEGKGFRISAKKKK